MPPLELDEFTARILRDALNHHHQRLLAKSRAAQDIVDREGWALNKVAALFCGIAAARLGRALGGGPSPELLQGLAARIRREQFGMRMTNNGRVHMAAKEQALNQAQPVRRASRKRREERAECEKLKNDDGANAPS